MANSAVAGAVAVDGVALDGVVLFVVRSRGADIKRPTVAMSSLVPARTATLLHRRQWRKLWRLRQPTQLPLTLTELGRYRTGPLLSQSLRTRARPLHGEETLPRMALLFLYLLLPLLL